MMSARQRHATGSDVSDGDRGRIVRDSSTTSQHSNDEPHDLPPLVGVPSGPGTARYAAIDASHQNGAVFQNMQKENLPLQAQGGSMQHSNRSNSLFDQKPGSPSLRRRLKLVRQQSEPDMMRMGRDLGIGSPVIRKRMVAPSPPPLDSPRSLSSSECNSPRIIRKPRSFHGPALVSRSVENSPRIIRRAMSITPQSPNPAHFPGELLDSPKNRRSHSFQFDSPNLRPELNVSPMATGSPFTTRRGVALRIGGGSRPETPSLIESLPAVNGNVDGCVGQPVQSQEARRSLHSDDDNLRPNGKSVSMDSIHNALLDHVASEERYAHARVQHHPLRKQHQQLPNQLPSQDSHEQHEPYNIHHHQGQVEHHPSSNENGWLDRNSYADCSPPPANSPTREVTLGVADNADNVQNSFTSSYSSGSGADRVKIEEISNEELNRRHPSSLYDIDEARELADELQNGLDRPKSAEHQGDDRLREDSETPSNDVETLTSRHKDSHTNDVAQETNTENNNIEETEKRENGVAIEENGKQEGNEEDDEENEMEDESEDESYDETVPEYQKAPLSTKLRIKNWLAGLDGSVDSNASRIDRFLPEIK